jgi:hypothetical protein
MLGQFASGWALAHRSNVPLSAAPIEGFARTAGYNFGTAAFRPLDACSGNEPRIDLDACLGHLGGGGDVVINGCPQCYGMMLPMKREIKALLSDSRFPSPIRRPGPDDLVVHVRPGDYLAPESAPRLARPLEDLLAVIERQSFRRLFIATDEPAHPFIQLLRGEFRCIIGGKNELDDFAMMLCARRLVLAPSMFSWWAAWLGNAQEIHFPANRGIFRENSGIDQWFGGERRWVAY